MLFLVPFAIVVLAVSAVVLARRRHRLQRDRSMILGEMKALVRLLDESLSDPPIRFTRPFRSDEDRAHDTMFSASFGSTRLSFILDTSRMRVRWWVLYELFAPEAAGSARTLRVEADFIERTIPTALIQVLLKAARDATAAAPSTPPAERLVDPFEPIDAGHEPQVQEAVVGDRKPDQPGEFIPELGDTGPDMPTPDKPPHG